jgi:hypothetical protein
VTVVSSPGRRAGLELLYGKFSRRLTALGRTEKLPNQSATQSVLTIADSETLANLRQATLSGNPGVALCLVELRGFEPLTPCMPGHPHHLTRPSATSPDTTSALLRWGVGQGSAVRREAACGIAADNLLTAHNERHSVANVCSSTTEDNGG